jgi:hypothetical protein
MSRHLFQLARLSLCNTFIDPFFHSENAAHHAALVADRTDNLQSLVHSLRHDVFLELGPESSRATSHA